MLDLGLKLRCIHYGFCGLGGLQECKDNFFFEVRRDDQCFLVGSIKVLIELPKFLVVGPALILPSFKSSLGML